ncbi:hypothetical protein IQ241_02665 [Romeria aff. gracilis LEGE 07310]|uniref:Uncharacterized protein n=1 Tax=Vasconcelosia minhoensis LEGE 07310 TaxID=915328 RepID=A0A8J7DAA8_9CYAN|nr:hypothetical protein [Romeria gracilis]MBE9076207.1 hypothetical protein [Romeria aff. gracilis LEGE 07310]
MPARVEASSTVRVITSTPHRYPGGRHRLVIIRDRIPDEEEIVVEFVAPGQEWAEVLLDGRRVFSPRNFNRRQRLRLEPGAYRLEITGHNRFEIWATGYLDIGRDDSNVVVVTFSRAGVQTSGSPYVWIPDGP